MFFVGGLLALFIYCCHLDPFCTFELLVGYTSTNQSTSKKKKRRNRGVTFCLFSFRESLEKDRSSGPPIFSGDTRLLSFLLTKRRGQQTNKQKLEDSRCGLGQDSVLPLRHHIVTVFMDYCILFFSVVRS